MKAKKVRRARRAVIKQNLRSLKQKKIYKKQNKIHKRQNKIYKKQNKIYKNQIIAGPVFIARMKTKWMTKTARPAVTISQMIKSKI